MANRKKGSRSRKRRSGHATPPSPPKPATAAPDVAHSGSGADSAPSAVHARPRRQRAAERRAAEAAKGRDYRAPGSVGERPRAPWHPFPLAELMILVGLVAIAIGAARGEAGKTILLTGVAIVVLGTLDTTVREHWSGYRSHAGLLASVPTAAFHGGAALLLYALGAPSITWVLVPIALDVPLFAVLLKLLRTRFADARRERVFAGQR